MQNAKGIPTLKLYRDALHAARYIGREKGATAGIAMLATVRAQFRANRNEVDPPRIEELREDVVRGLSNLCGCRGRGGRGGEVLTLRPPVASFVNSGIDSPALSSVCVRRRRGRDTPGPNSRSPAVCPRVEKTSRNRDRAQEGLSQEGLSDPRA